MILALGFVLFSSLSFSAHATLGNATILVVGDSIGAGYGVPNKLNWVTLLEQHLETRKVVNASISGDTSSGARSRLPALLKHYNPNIVIIEIGGNDGLRGQPVKLLEQNLSSMIDQCRNSGAEVLLLGMRIPPNYGKAYTEAFHETYQKVAQSKSVALVPFLLDGIALHPELMQEDRIHPNEKAQPKLLENILPALEPLVN